MMPILIKFHAAVMKFLWENYKESTVGDIKQFTSNKGEADESQVSVFADQKTSTEVYDKFEFIFLEWYIEKKYNHRLILVEKDEIIKIEKRNT